ncbi:hypothetical protein GCM10009678_92980 [Actinomadura kijaniata]
MSDGRAPVAWAAGTAATDPAPQARTRAAAARRRLPRGDMGLLRTEGTGSADGERPTLLEVPLSTLYVK